MSIITDIASLLKDGNRSWNCYLGAEIGVKPAIIFSSLILKAKYYAEHSKSDDGWFYCTIDDLYQSTLLKYKSQTSAIKKLVNLKLIEVKTEGLFNKRYFRIIADELSALIEKGKDMLKVIGKAVKKSIVSEEVKKETASADDPRTKMQILESYKKTYGRELSLNDYDEYKKSLDSISSAIENRLKPWQIVKLEYSARAVEGISNGNIADFIGFCYRKIKGRKPNNIYGYLLTTISNTDSTEYTHRSMATIAKAQSSVKTIDDYIKKLI